MKKVLLFVFTLFLIAAYAQERQKKWFVQEKAGMNASYLGGEGVSTVKIGFHAGALIGRFVSDKLSIKSGLLYDQRGFRLENRKDKDSKIKIAISAITMPIFVQYEAALTSDRLKLFFYGGPFLSFLFNPDIEYRNQKVELDKKYHSKFDVGLGFGLGFLYAISNNMDFIADIGAKSGFVNYFNDEGRKTVGLVNEDTQANVTRNLLTNGFISVGLRQRF